jgi:hypothetical protein
VTAIGDSPHDIGMLTGAEFAYAPANCSSLIRDLAKQGKCRIVNRRFQNGLLAAVQDRLRHEPTVRRKEPSSAAAIETEREVLYEGLMASLLRAADRGPLPQALSALMWWSI